MEVNMDMFASFYMMAFNILVRSHGMDPNKAMTIMNTGDVDYLDTAAGGMKIFNALSKEDLDFSSDLFGNDADLPLLSAEKFDPYYKPDEDYYKKQNETDAMESVKHHYRNEEAERKERFEKSKIKRIKPLNPCISLLENYNNPLKF